MCSGISHLCCLSTVRAGNVAQSSFCCSMGNSLFHVGFFLKVGVGCWRPLVFLAIFYLHSLNTSSSGILAAQYDSLTSELFKAQGARRIFRMENSCAGYFIEIKHVFYLSSTVAPAALSLSAAAVASSAFASFNTSAGRFSVMSFASLSPKF